MTNPVCDVVRAATNHDKALLSFSCGPDSDQAMAQMFGLRQLLKDGWEIFHTVARKAPR